MNNMRAKVTSINYAVRELTPEHWLSVANALSGVWGWTQTALMKVVNNTNVFVKNVTWRVTPGGAVLNIGIPKDHADATSWKVILPFHRGEQDLYDDYTEKPSTIVHDGGFVEVVDGSGWGAPRCAKINRGDVIAELGAASSANQDRVKIELSFYYVEG